MLVAAPLLLSLLLLQQKPDPALRGISGFDVMVLVPESSVPAPSESALQNALEVKLQEAGIAVVSTESAIMAYAAAHNQAIPPLMTLSVRAVKLDNTEGPYALFISLDVNDTCHYNNSYATVSLFHRDALYIAGKYQVAESATQAAAEQENAFINLWLKTNPKKQ